jgi:hypothetical protein
MCRAEKLLDERKGKSVAFFQMKLETDRMLKSQQNSLLCQVK